MVFTKRGVFEETDGSLSAYQQLVVSSPSEIARLVSSIRLHRKGQCKCAHLNEAVFETRSIRIKVSFCNHCFDVMDGVTEGGGRAEVRLYRMPKEFHEEFERYAKNKEKWQSVSPE